MAKSIKLLLVENVDSLGIVGDVVNVRTGYARNFLLPRQLATTPSDELVQSLAAKRADAQKQLAQLRKHREETTGKLKGVEITLVRSCNDQGILYGAITQQDIATALNELGHSVKPREVRIAQTIKRIDSFDVHVKLDSDLDAVVKVIVKADRELDMSKKDEPEVEHSGGQDRDDPRDRMEDRRAARRNALDEAISKALTEKPKGFGGGEKAASDAPKEGKGEKGEKSAKKGDGEKKAKKKAE